MAKKIAGKSNKSDSKGASKARKGGKSSQVSAVVLMLVLVVCTILYLRNLNAPAPEEMPSPAPVEQVKSADTSAPKSEKKKQTVAAKEKKSTADKSKKGHSASKLQPEKDLRPDLIHPYASQLIEHLGYVVSYNADFKVPNWVIYELNYAETLGNMKRVNNFAVDPMVKEEEMAQLTDYRNSGYDRGHMAPNADLNWSEQAQNESFYLSNMCPQGHDFNAGIWLDLETQVRKWAERDSAVTIVCGPVLPRTKEAAKKMKYIGKGHVIVPEYFYKIVLVPFGKEMQAIGFLMPGHNEKDGRKNRALTRYAVTVDSIESLTGIDFFPALPDAIENKIESKYNLDYWFK